MKPSILLYLDYRHYLADLFESMKSDDAGCSFREFARLAGSTSPNFLQLIRDRKLNISTAAIGTLSHAIGLSKKEETFFETIVAFDHAKSHDEKDKHFQRIIRMREHTPAKSLQRKQYDFFSHWYIPVVRELVTSERYPDDPAWLAERVVPSITVSKARKAVQLLESLDLIRRDTTTNRWVQTERAISTPEEVVSLAVTKHTKSICALGSEAIDRFSSAERDIRGITLGIPEEAYPELKDRVVAFWQELLTFAQKQQRVDRVYQVNLQLFPVSRQEEKES